MGSGSVSQISVRQIMFTFISESTNKSDARESSRSRRLRVGLLLEDVVVGPTNSPTNTTTTTSTSTTTEPLDVVEDCVPVVRPPAGLAGRGRQERSRGELTDGRVLVHYSHGLPLASPPRRSQLLLLWHLLLLLLLLLGRHS